MGSVCGWRHRAVQRGQQLEPKSAVRRDCGARPSEQVAPEDPPSRKDVAQASATKRRLFADDLRDSADSLALVLKMMGHEVHTAYDGEDAFVAVNKFKPDVVLLDIGMPKLNGYDLCRRIRQQPWGKGIHLVALTGWGQEDDRRRTDEAGFDHHIVKPINPTELMTLLDPLHVSSLQ